VAGAALLAAHICLLVTFAHLMKWSELRGADRAVVVGLNYLVAALGGLVWYLASGAPALLVETLFIGAASGIVYVAGLYLYVALIASSGVCIATSIIRLSVVAPLLAAVLYWREQPTPGQILGAVLVLVALPLLSGPWRGSDKPLGGGALLLLPALLFTSGSAQVLSKAFASLGAPAQLPLYTLILFSTAMVGALLPFVRQRPVLMGQHVALGVALGLANLLGNAALLMALQRLPGVVVFPVASSGGLVLAVLSSLVIWGERLQRPAQGGVALAVVALALIGSG